MDEAHGSNESCSIKDGHQQQTLQDDKQELLRHFAYFMCIIS